MRSAAMHTKMWVDVVLCCACMSELVATRMHTQLVQQCIPARLHHDAGTLGVPPVCPVIHESVISNDVLEN